MSNTKKDKEKGFRRSLGENLNKNIKYSITIVICSVLLLIVGLFLINYQNSNKKIETLVKNYDEFDTENDFTTKTLIVKTTKTIDTRSTVNVIKIIRDMKIADEFSKSIDVINVGDYSILKFETEEQTEEVYNQLKNSNNIESVEIDSVLTTSLEDEIEESENNDSENELNKDSELKKYIDENSNIENEVKVAVLDTGINKNNELFIDRLIDVGANYSTSGNENDIQDDNSHGTDMAAIIAKNTNSNVKIMPIKIANENGQATILQMYLGIQKAISEKADVINISMSTYSTEASLMIEDIINKATEKGIIVVVSSGNEGMEVANFTPANIENVITIGAVGSTYTLMDISNYGHGVNYVANGVYEGKRGTSYSAAFVSSVVALLKSTDTSLNTVDVKNILNQYAIDLGDEGHDDYYGDGLISLININTIDLGNQDNEMIVTDSTYPNILKNNIDWKNMSDSELDTLLKNQNETTVAYFILSLSEEDKNLLLSKDTLLVKPVYKIVFDELIETDADGSENWKTHQEIEYNTYYDYVLEIVENFEVDAFDSSSGYFNINVGTSSSPQISMRVSVTGVTESNSTLTVGTSGSKKYSISGTLGTWSTEYCKIVVDSGQWSGVELKGTYVRDGHRFVKWTDNQESIVTGRFGPTSDITTWNHHTGAHTDTVTIQCNAYNMGLSKYSTYGYSHYTGNIRYEAFYYNQLKINPNSGSHGGNTTTYVYGTKKCTTTATIANPTRTGYKFTSWTVTNGSNANGSISNGVYSYCTTTRSSEDSPTVTTLTANWTPTTLTVNYNANGGTNAPSPQTMSYGTNYNLTSTIPTKTGYTFVGWTASATWNDTDEKYTKDTAAKAAQAWATTFGKNINNDNASITLYAQWEKTTTYTFYYYNNLSKTASVTFHNGETSKTMTIPSEARISTVTKEGSTFNFRGFKYNSATANSTVDIDKNTSSLNVNSSDSNKSYYASYERTVTVNYIESDNGNKITTKETGMAYLAYNASTINATFKALDLSDMALSEKNVKGELVSESWTARGWSTKTTSNSDVEKYQNETYGTYKDITFYGLYQKNVTLTYNPNGGTVSPTKETKIRYYNAAGNDTKEIFILPKPVYNGYYYLCWTNSMYDIDYFGTSQAIEKVKVGTTNNEGTYTYVPLVSDVVYAYWVTEPIDVVFVEVSKSAQWNNPEALNETNDFENLQDIDPNGIAKVTVTAKITDKESVGARTISVTDYYNTEIWDYYQDSTYKTAVSSGIFSKTDNTFTWTIPNSYTSGEEMTLTYYVKLKETYWDVDGNIDYYINKINDLTSYKDALDEDGILIPSKTYQTVDAKALVKINYTVNGGVFSGTVFDKYNSTPFVEMRAVNWMPITNKVSISSTKNNIYKKYGDDYENTYYVQYDTKGNESTYNIKTTSNIKRAREGYKITNNLLDIRYDSLQEVINNFLSIDGSNKNSKIDTDNFILEGLEKNLILNLASGNSYRVASNNLNSVDTVSSTNIDGTRINIYPVSQTYNEVTDTYYTTTQDKKELSDKKLDIIVDGTPPTITPDSMISTSSTEYGDWTESDGYADINLVSSSINPVLQEKTLTFRFEDALSGINDPNQTTEDWINTSSQNVQIKLERVDNDEITIYDSKDNTTNTSDVVNVTYGSSTNINRTGKIEITLNPNNEEILGHLKLTIKVIDNVSNSTEKTYDLYVFALTGAVQISDTLPNFLERNQDDISIKSFINGEAGIVKISTAGYVDRVTANFGEYLTNLSEIEPKKSTSTYKINGDYPRDDITSNSYSDSLDKSIIYLPKEWQTIRWGFNEGELGGVRLSIADQTGLVKTVDNSVINENIDRLTLRYQDIDEGKTLENEIGSNYIIINDTLYTNPIVEDGDLKSYEHSYKAYGFTDLGGKTYPEYLILDGSKSIIIEYGANRVASIEDLTIIDSGWKIIDGTTALRPLYHYFYMPLYAEARGASNPYYVTLKAYKDSNKEFKHWVAVKISFYNSKGGNILSNLQTIIKDN